MMLLQDGWTALSFASQNGHTATVKALMDRGAQVNLQNKVIYNRVRLISTPLYILPVEPEIWDGSELIRCEVDHPAFQLNWTYYLFYHLSNFFLINKCYGCRMGVPPFTLLLSTGIPLRSRRSWIEGHRLTFRIR